MKTKSHELDKGSVLLCAIEIDLYIDLVFDLTHTGRHMIVFFIEKLKY